VFLLADAFGSRADSVVVPVTLATNNPAPPAVKMTEVTVNAPAVIGPAVPNTPIAITFTNAGGTFSQGAIRLTLAQGFSLRFLSPNTAIDCGGGIGVIPPGGCTVNTKFYASNQSQGTGTLVAGPANLMLQLVDPSNNVIASQIVHVTLATP
jgi:hypothetical protein